MHNVQCWHWVGQDLHCNCYC